MAEADLRAKCESNGTTKTLKALAGDTVRYIDTISALQKIVVCYGDRDRMASANKPRIKRLIPARTFQRNLTKGFDGKVRQRKSNDH